VYFKIPRLTVTGTSGEEIPEHEKWKLQAQEQKMAVFVLGERRERRTINSQLEGK